MKAVVFIDVQNDFVLHNGALPVPGAEDTAKKIIDFAKKCRSRDMPCSPLRTRTSRLNMA